MNKTAIKNYAIWARTQLIESVKQRAFEYEITENGENKINVEVIGGRLLSKDEKQQRSQLITHINQKGYEQVMEEAAYIWFNRFIALRYMEANSYLSTGIRVFTNEEGEFKPEILREAMTIELDGLNREKVIDLLDRQDNESLYRILLIAQCNSLNAGMPYIFEKIANWTELLFPKNLLRSDSVIGRMISDIDIDDWTDEVEILGWLYQYYISERHEEVVDSLHGKIVRKEDIPAATQLFTTDWVVRYIIDNSLGRYWVERHPESKLRDKLTYLAKTKDGDIKIVEENVSPEEMTVFDPCVGSGHFLSYAFDVLMEIYRECGWSDRDAAKKIIESNLYGLDIDDRAGQLAYFSVLMKARRLNRKILNESIVPHIYSIQDSIRLTDSELDQFGEHRKTVEKIIDTFDNAKEYGSIIQIDIPDFDIRALSEYLFVMEKKYDEVDLVEQSKILTCLNIIKPLLNQAEVLAGKYVIVVTNPPYLNKFSDKLKAYVSKFYETYKGDLFAVFMFRNFGFCKKGGYSGFMTPIAWMFNKSFNKLREEILNNHAIISLIQMAPGAFKDAGIDICSFILSKNYEDIEGIYYRLDSFKGDMDVQNNAIISSFSDFDCNYCFRTNGKEFHNIPGTPIAYWISPQFNKIFVNAKLLGTISSPRQGMATSDNTRFLRLWYEIDSTKMYLTAQSHQEAFESQKKWFPYNKGGDSRKWYGNNDYLINWENDGNEVKLYAESLYKCVTRTIQNIPYYFKECFTWSLISNTNISFRYKPVGSIFDKAGMSCFSSNMLYELLSLCNSKLCPKFIEILAPTLNCQAGDVANIPVLDMSSNKEKIKTKAINNIQLSRDDWDSFEISWDFKKHPLI